MIQIAGRTWAVTEEVAEQLRQHHANPGMGQWLSGVGRAVEALSAASDQRVADARGGAVAVIPVFGMILQRASWFGTSTERLGATVRAAAADKSIQAIVMEIDSPGGEVYGVQECAAVIRDARASKPVVACASSMAASAAYWLASQADELVVTHSGDVGSIGVYGMHADLSKALDQMGVKVTLISAGKYKVEGNPFEPLGDEALASMQSDVNRHYASFTQDVAKGRRVSVDAVRAGFGQGRLVGAKAAVEHGMADSVGTLDDAIRRAASLGAERRRATAAMATVQAERYRLERG